ncbi:hemophore-related protein, partial [Mycobacterium sp. ITM-2017-0098]
MNFSGIAMRRAVAGVGAAAMFGGLAAATVAAP